MPTLRNEHHLMTYGGHVELEDGAQQPVEFDLTVGAVRAYRDDPDPCQCENCRKMFPTAMRLLALQEDYLDGRITDRQLKRSLKRMGYVRGEKIQRH